MWVFSQNDEGVYKISFMYVVDKEVLTIIDDEVLVLGQYECTMKAKEIIKKFKNIIILGGKTFQMP